MHKPGVGAYSHLLGIDEAGLGPLLGPLTIGHCLFQLGQPLTPDGILALDLWERLGVGRTPSERRHRPVVCDSKKLYTPARGVKALEEELLCWAALAGHEATEFESFFGAFCALGRGDTQEYDWYREPPQHFPLQAGFERTRLRAQPIRRALKEAGLAFTGLGVAPLLVQEFNRLVQSTGNKARTETEIIARVISHYWQRCRNLAVVCDRLGGRERYGGTLAALFPEAEIHVFVESPRISSYELCIPEVEDAPRLFIAFIEKGESDHLPIALASMAAKYVRELMMHQFNAWFARHDASLKPTAGYYKDGRRWLQDTAALRDALGIDDSFLIRSR